MQITSHFTLVRETKGALRYQEIDPTTHKEHGMYDPETVVGTLYIRKQAINGNPYPTNLAITIESSTKG